MIVFGDRLSRILTRLSGKPTGRRAVAAEAMARAVWVETKSPMNRHERRRIAIEARTVRRAYSRLIAKALRGIR